MSRRSIDIPIERRADAESRPAAVLAVLQDGTQALRGLQRSRFRVAFAILALQLAHAPASAQAPPPPADTYADEATRDLVERAMAARTREAVTIQSYEATLRQRLYTGVTAFRFRRERALFEHERVARIRWSRDEGNAIRWMGWRTAIPIIGADTNDRDNPLADRDDRERRAEARRSRQADDDDGRAAGDEEDEPDDDEDLDEFEDLASNALDETDLLAFDFAPGADRLRFGDDWAHHPLADSASLHYRYRLGDTLRVELPANERNVVLYEVRVEPRRADFDLVAGSLWFDSLSTSLVRATYRPARPWSFRVDEPEDADEVPGWVGPIEAEIRYITVESSLQELEHWLPRRFSFQAEGRGGWLFRIPVTLEWSVGGYIVNEDPIDVYSDGPLPEGWQRREVTRTDADSTETVYTVVVPTSEELRASLGSSPDFGRRTPVAFSPPEIEELTAELESLIPTYRRFVPRLAWGLDDGQVRYNRVEGLSVGASTTTPLSPSVFVDAEARIGTADLEPNVSGALRLGGEWSRWSLEGYHRLASMSEEDDPFDFSSSALNLFFGTDRGEYFRVTGASGSYEVRVPSLTASMRVFHERHRAVGLNSEFSVRGIIRPGPEFVRPVRQAADVDVTGAAWAIGWFRGTDPRDLVVTGAIGGEVGFNEVEYQRAHARLSASNPLPFDLVGAVELAVGTSWGDLPLQRSYFLGGSGSLRGYDLNEFVGASFWRARGEVATGFAGARVSVFSDLGWAGAPADFRFDDPLVSVGLGGSLLDGLIRADVAHSIRGANRLKVHLYLDGLF